MTQDAAEAAVRALLDARRTGRKLDSLPAGAEPADDAQAYAIQSAIVAALGQPVAGWKVNVVEGKPPGYAPMLRDDALASPARLALGARRPLGIEAEVAFVIAREVSLPVRGVIEPAMLADRLAGACAAIELVESRFADLAQQPRLAALADQMSNGAFVAGATQPDWARLDLEAVPVRLLVNGAVVADRRGGNPAVAPLLAATWLANRLAERGLPLQPGQIVTTGSYTGLTKVKAGDRILARFDGIGDAELTLD
jgi:2-keto-4-pentenoate hydratase